MSQEIEGRLSREDIYDMEKLYARMLKNYFEKINIKMNTLQIEQWPI